MFSLVVLIALCVGYYYLHKYYPRSQKEMIYFGIFISIYSVVLYLANFQKDLLHKLFRQIYDIQKRPLYDLSDFSKPDQSIQEFQKIVLHNQGNRCAKCHNYILPADSHYASFEYKTPLHLGGTSTHDNLMVVCPTCHSIIY